MGRDAARHLNDGQDSDGAIDYWMVDQIIPYMALAVIKTNSPSKIIIPSLTRHAQTNVWIVENFLPVEFLVQDNTLICQQKV